MLASEALCGNSRSASSRAAQASLNLENSFLPERFFMSVDEVSNKKVTDFSKCIMNVHLQHENLISSMALHPKHKSAFYVLRNGHGQTGKLKPHIQKLNENTITTDHNTKKLHKH